MTIQFKDYYKILGVKRSASAGEIKKAYRAAAKRYHPDRKGNGSADKSKFIEISEAYEVLGDLESRGRYDSLGSGWKAGDAFRPPPGWKSRADKSTKRPRKATRTKSKKGAKSESGKSFSDFFSFFSGAGSAASAKPSKATRKGSALETELTVTLQEAVEGANKTVTLAVQEDPALGKSKTTQNSYTIRVPAGIRDGQVLRLKASPAAEGDHQEDIHLRIRIEPHPTFSLEDDDLCTELRVSPWEAALGATIRVPTLKGMARLKLPRSTSSGQRLRLKGQGRPKGKGKDAGDLIYRAMIVLPKKLSDSEEELLEKLAKASKFNPRGNS